MTRTTTIRTFTWYFPIQSIDSILLIHNSRIIHNPCILILCTFGTEVPVDQVKSFSCPIVCSVFHSIQFILSLKFESVTPIPSVGPRCRVDYKLTT